MNIEEAARRLGVSDEELFRRYQLGLEQGLAFAAMASQDSVDAQTTDDGLTLVADAQTFSVSTQSMTALDLARRALWAQFERMINMNPLRFIRTWMPWMAIVEGYSELLEKSRFRIRFRKVREDVERELANGERVIPVLW